MTIASQRAQPGSDAYWQDRRAAFAHIRTLEAAIDYRRRAPLYIAGSGYDAEDGFDDVIENIGPWDRVLDLQNAARRNPMVMDILTAQKRLTLLAV